MRKAVFFDIDGTIWDQNMYIPESTREAMQKLKENNVYTFLCSGRTRAYIREPKLLALGFDGILSGCGTQVEFGDSTLFYQTIENDLVKKTLQILKKYGLPVVLEGRNHLYVEPEEFVGDLFLERLTQDMGEDLLRISEHEMEWEVSKFSATLTNDAFEDALMELTPWYELIVHGKRVVEGVPKGFGKAFGIKTVCERLGIAQEDTYAFGDSVNDLDMLQYAAHGIAMGDGMEEAKAAADYVTNGIYEDGIYHALKHFGLI